MIIDLTSWWLDVSAGFGHVTDEAALLSQISRFGRQLGFSHLSFGAKGTGSGAHDTAAHILSNYPEAWLERYMAAGYLLVDPTVGAGTRTRRAIVWSDALFRQTRSLWSEAQDFGLRAGIAQPGWARGGRFTLLSLARDSTSVTRLEADALQPYLLILSQCATAKLQDLADKEQARSYMKRLSPREIEVLKLSAVGKTASALSTDLGIAYATVQFHLQNAKKKLGVTTKIQAIVSARRLGVID